MTTRADVGRKQRVAIPIRVKMAVALMLPLAAVAALSIVQIGQARDRVSTVEEETQLASVALTPVGLTAALTTEQADVVLTLLDLRGTAADLPTATYEDSIELTDSALADLRARVAQGGPRAEALFDEPLAGIEGILEAQRARTAEFRAEVGLHNWTVTEEIYVEFSAAIEALNAVNFELTQQITDTELRAAAETLHDVNLVDYRVSRAIRRIGDSLANSEPVVRNEAIELFALYKAATSSLEARTNGPWAGAVREYADNPANEELVTAMQAWIDSGDLDLDDLISKIPSVDLDADAEPEPGSSKKVGEAAHAGMLARIDELITEAEEEQNNYTLLGIAVVAGATIAALVVAGSIVRPMRKLTRQAEEMAAVTLPGAVQAVLDTPPDQDVVIPELAPVHVRSHDELQTVATAINHVQSSAVNLAVEQATLRRNIADSFVSLGRRTQNLIGLQLELITNLEAEEADPAVLESLYRLDHLATRARRNAESLVVLGGTSSQQASSTPVVMSDVVRAMLSEVEAYQRVSIDHVDDAFVPGSSAADVIHLLAELVENGLAFSPPRTDVVVHGHRDAAGYTITVTDQGVGMTAERLEQANRRLADNESFTVAPSRYLGHYVTGKLARRVGAKVTLAAAPEGGIVATVFLPVGSLTDDTAARRSAPPVGEGASAPTSNERREARAAENDNDNDNDNEGPAQPAVKVDGRAPVLVGAPAKDTSNGNPAPVLASVVDAPTETTDVGLRKRVPGVHVKAAKERSPLLRSAAGRTNDQGPLRAETTPEEAQNLASLLTDYTSGLERGREDLATTPTTQTTEHSE